MKVLIAEDDILIAEHLHDIIEECDLDTIHLAHNYEDIMFKIKNEKPDLVLLDIHIDQANTGIEIAKEINQNYKIPFIYITAQSDKVFMDLAIETLPFGYIIKPFNSKEIYAAIQLAKNSFVKKYTVVKDIYGDVKLVFDSILYIKADGNYLEIITLDKKIVARATISTFLEILPKNTFIQVHRSFVVNTKHIQKMNSLKLYIANNEIPFSKNKLKEIKAKMSE